MEEIPVRPFIRTHFSTEPFSLEKISKIPYETHDFPTLSCTQIISLRVNFREKSMQSAMSNYPNMFYLYPNYSVRISGKIITLFPLSLSICRITVHRNKGETSPKATTNTYSRVTGNTDSVSLISSSLHVTP